jgi:branched-chain amino acid aminotransferase
VSDSTTLWWIDGRLCEVDPQQLVAAPADEATASYTTARVRDGRAFWHDRHLQRLCRDATLLGLTRPAANAVEAAFRETGQANFGTGEGIVRLQIQPGAGGALQIVGIPRPIGAEAGCWSAVTAHFPHDGPTRALGAKLAGRGLFSRAHALSASEGVDEVLLIDADGYLIEGARSNLFVVSRDGQLSVPDLARGGVAGVAREILCELAQPTVRDIQKAELADASELIATNAVRGACPVATLDGNAIGAGAPGPVAARLASLLRAAAARV